jgi:hypothetical protein
MDPKSTAEELQQIPKSDLERLTKDLPRKRHSYSAKFPMMTVREYIRLRDSILASVKEGKIDEESPLAITTYNDEILEGWNRYVAASELVRSGTCDVPIDFIPFKGNEEEALKLVFRENFTRRHLSAEDKVRIALEVEEERFGEQPENGEEPSSEDNGEQPAKQKPKGRQVDRIAKATGVGSATVSRVKKKIKKASGKVKKVPEKDREAIKNRITDVLGEESYVNISQMHHDPELQKFANLDDDEMKELAGYVATGSTVKEAKYLAPKKLTASHTIKQYLQRAVANGGNYFQTFEAEGNLPAFEVQLNVVQTACEV